MTRRSKHLLELIVSLGFVAITALGMGAACSLLRDAPKSIEQLDTMPANEWQAWCESAAGWSAGAGYSAVKYAGCSYEDVERFASQLELRGFAADMFEAAAVAAELKRNPIVDQLLREAQSLVNLKLHLTAGQRFGEWVTRVRLALLDGALRARSEAQR